MTTCPNKEKNMAKCNCSYDPCARKGVCCECLHYHRASGQLPACFFTTAQEATYDRSVAAFVRQRAGK